MSTPALPKPQRFESAEYRAFIRQHACCVWNCWKRTEAHHVVFDGQGRIGTKVDDTRCVALCDAHHRQYHDWGREEFERRYSLNLAQIIIDLLTEYIRGKGESHEE